jgi:hypothetical protein
VEWGQWGDGLSPFEIKNSQNIIHSRNLNLTGLFVPFFGAKCFHAMQIKCNMELKLFGINYNEDNIFNGYQKY